MAITRRIRNAKINLDQQPLLQYMEVNMCNTLVEKYKPIGRYQEDVKLVNVKCGNTWIDGSDVLCDQCESEG